MTDKEIEDSIRDDLYYGSVSSAKDRVGAIEDPDLAREMRALIREYEG